METPLYTALTALSGAHPARFHMPGHKGYPLTPALAMAPLDFTEVTGSGNLYGGDDVIAQSAALWAKACAMPHCQYLTGGATQGLHAGLLLCARRGKEILCDRGAHRGVYHALALFEMTPTFLPHSNAEPITAQQVEQALSTHPDIKTVCITSPTYYGVLSNIKEISAITRRYGAALFVDGAHGAHLPLVGENPFLGADLWVTSAHKTLPALGQSALLFSGGLFGQRDLAWAASVCGTSSPSYPILLSMELALAYMQGAGRETYRQAAEGVATLRGKFPSLSGGDPLRFVLRCDDGYGVLAALERLGVVPEMADGHHVVFIVTGQDVGENLTRLETALASLHLPAPAPVTLAPPPLPTPRLTPAQALVAQRETGALAGALGRISAQQIAPYPPGIPVVAAGEEITKNVLAYLDEIGYNMEEGIQLVIT